MPIRQSDLLNSSVNRSFAGQSRPRVGQLTAFLSHSHQDALLALGLQEMLKKRAGTFISTGRTRQCPPRPTVRQPLTSRSLLSAQTGFSFWRPKTLWHCDGVRGKSALPMAKKLMIASPSFRPRTIRAISTGMSTSAFTVVSTLPNTPPASHCLIRGATVRGYTTFNPIGSARV